MTLKQALKIAAKSKAFGSHEVTVTEQGYIISSEKIVSGQRVPVYYRFYRPVNLTVYNNSEGEFSYSGMYGNKWRLAIPLVYFFYGEISKITVLERGNGSQNSYKYGIDTVVMEITYEDGFVTNLIAAIKYNDETVLTSLYHEDDTLDLRLITPHDGFSIDINSPKTEEVA